VVLKFCLYSIFKNLRFFERFFIIYLLAPASLGGAGLSFFRIGVLTGYQKLLTALLEVPTGFLADRRGRRLSLTVCFASYVAAFPLYALSAGREGALQLVVLAAAQTFFAVGEAFRTGTNKAIMLDWVDRTRPPGGATRLVGVTRFWSKVAAGVSALAGGLLLWRTASFAPLFWLAVLPAAAGVVLVRTYPAWLEGEYSRERGAATRLPWRTRLAALWAVPGIVLLFVQSVLFESQIKLAQHYLQPFLEFGLARRDVAVVGGIGAVLIGLYYLVQDGLGGISSRLAPRTEGLAGGGKRASAAIHATAATVVFGVAGSLLENWILAGILGFLVLAILQNLRRPIFVSRFNEVMDKPQRAATLSVESQARSLAFAILAPATGWVADAHGLAGVFLVLGVLLADAALLGRR